MKKKSIFTRRGSGSQKPRSRVWRRIQLAAATLAVVTTLGMGCGDKGMTGDGSIFRDADITDTSGDAAPVDTGPGLDIKVVDKPKDTVGSETKEDVSQDTGPGAEVSQDAIVDVPEVEVTADVEVVQDVVQDTGVKDTPEEVDVPAEVAEVQDTGTVDVTPGPLNGFTHCATILIDGDHPEGFAHRIVLPENFLDIAGARFVQGNCEDAANASEVDFLPYWVESVSDSNIIVWVRTTDANQSAISLVSGNTAIFDQSNGDAVFEFFDGFDYSGLDGSKWKSQGTVTVVGDGFAELEEGAHIVTANAYPYATTEVWTATYMDGFVGITDMTVDGVGSQQRATVLSYKVDGLDELVFSTDGVEATNNKVTPNPMQNLKRVVQRVVRGLKRFKHRITGQDDSTYAEMNTTFEKDDLPELAADALRTIKISAKTGVVEGEWAQLDYVLVTRSVWDRPTYTVLDSTPLN